MNKGILYIVATPIGNLGDITLRALEVLKGVDLILCEDTRVTAKLLEHFAIKKPVDSYHHHTDAKKMRGIISRLQNGENLALVTDAGTPGISDPGNMLVAEALRIDPEIQIFGIPGASAIAVALSISGFPTDKFTFMGFPPHKNKRQKYFKEVGATEHTVIFYESGHRILKCMQELKEILKPDTQVMVCRELTKKFETVYRGNILEVAEKIKDERGEFVVVVNNN